jgi:O-antigen/teichoic acid export membrane protein
MTGEAVQATPIESPLASWRTMIRNFGLLAISEGIARLLSFVAIIWMTRKLSVDGFGVVSLGMNLAIWFGMIANSSRTIGLRDAAREPERFKEITEPLLGVRLAMAVVAMAALAVTAAVVGDSAQDREVILLFMLVLPFFSLNLRFSVLAVGSAKAIAAGNIVSQLVFAAGVLLFVTAPGDAIFVPISQAAGELVFASILVAAMAPRFGLLIPRVNKAVWRSNLVESAPLMVQQAGRATINWYDSLLIAVLLTQAQVGLYSAAYRPILFTTYSIGLLFMSFFAAYNAAQSEQTREMLLSRTVRLSAGISLPIAIAFSAGAGLIVSVLFGENYADAAIPLAILAWTVPILATGSCFGLVLVSHHQQVLVMRHALAGVAFNVLANFLAVPVFGIGGAATITVGSILLTSVLNYRSCTGLGLAPALTELLSGSLRLRRDQAVSRDTTATQSKSATR